MLFQKHVVPEASGWAGDCWSSALLISPFRFNQMTCGYMENASSDLFGLVFSYLSFFYLLAS